MGEYMDEKILKQKASLEKLEKQRFSKEQIEEENNQSIFSGEILIHQVPVAFSERKILGDLAVVWMPTDFEELDEEEISMIYPLGNKPQNVWGNTYLNLSIGFNHTEHAVPDHFMGEFAKAAKNILETAGPKVTTYSVKNYKRGTHHIASLELVSHTLNAAIYNLAFYSTLDGRVLMGFINFGYNLIERYRPIAKEMFESFHFIETKEE